MPALALYYVASAAQPNPILIAAIVCGWLGDIFLIVLMGASTVPPLGSVSTAGAITAMAGAFVFMVSDTLNAYNRFVREIPLERLYTMGTYLVGQFLLVQGYLFF